MRSYCKKAVPPEQLGIKGLVPTLKTPQPHAKAFFEDIAYIPN
jgi:hypothetical protein